jgi:hypothetical protein
MERYYSLNALVPAVANAVYGHVIDRIRLARYSKLKGLPALDFPPFEIPGRFLDFAVGDRVRISDGNGHEFGLVSCMRITLTSTEILFKPDAQFRDYYLTRQNGKPVPMPTTLQRI